MSWVDLLRHAGTPPALPALHDRALSPVTDQRSVAAVLPPHAVNRPRWPSHDVGTYAAHHARSATLFACIAYRANAVASATTRIYRWEGSERQELPDHPLRQLLQAPNADQSESEFLALIQMVGDVAGFCPIEKVRSSAGRVVQLELLRPDWIKPIPREQAPPDWEYRVPGRSPVRLPAEDVLIYTPVPSLDRSATGMSAVGVALRQLGVESAMTDFLAALFQRGALPFIGLLFADDAEEPTDEFKAALKAQFAQRYGGAANWAEPALLGGGIKDIKPLGYNLNELAFPALRNMTDAQICQIFGVPPIVIGAQVGLERATYSNYDQARTSFYEDVVRALWVRLDGALTRSLLSEFEDAIAGVMSLEFDTSQVPALKADEAARWTQAADGVRAGFLTVNDARRHVGFPDLPGADVFQFNLTTLLLSAGSDLAATDYPAQIVDRDRAARNGQHRHDHGDTRDYDHRREPITEARSRIGASNRLRITRLGRQASPLVYRFFRDQGERVIAAIVEASERSRRDIAMPTDDVVDWDDEFRRLVEQLRIVHSAAGESAFDAINSQLNATIAWDLANPNVRRVLNRLGDRIVGIHQRTREDVQRIVGDGIDEGLTVDQIADNLRGLYEETYRNRSVTIARTESMRAYSYASVTGYEETGIVAEVQLLDNPAHDTDPGDDGLTCAERNGLVVPLGQADTHINAEHPNGTLAVAPIVMTPMLEEVTA